MEKIAFEVPPAEWHSANMETLWATKVGDDAYRLENSPFCVRGYSFLDTVYAPYSEEHGLPVVRSVLEKSGHSTYLLWVTHGVESNGSFGLLWQALEDIGCSYEGKQSQLLSVDIPPETSIQAAYKLMQQGEESGVWYFQEQDYAPSAQPIVPADRLRRPLN